MSENTEAVEELLLFIKKAIDSQKGKGFYDKSIRAKVNKVLGGNKYEISKNRDIFTVTSINGIVYNVGDSVVVTFIENIRENGIIMGKF